MNRLSLEERAKVLHYLVECNSMRAKSNLCDVSKAVAWLRQVLGFGIIFGCPPCALCVRSKGIHQQLMEPVFSVRVFNRLMRCTMARVCQVTGKAPMVGNNVSHANNKTKRRFLPNLQYRRFWVESENRWVRLRLTNAGLRTIDKNGIDAILADLRASGIAI